MSLQIKRGDLEPALVLVAEDAAGTANLNSVVSWRVLASRRGVLVVNGVPDSVVVDPGNPARATLTRRWQAGETDDLGDMRVEVEAMWPGARPQTFPPADYEVVRVHADLG